MCDYNISGDMENYKKIYINYGKLGFLSLIYLLLTQNLIAIILSRSDANIAKAVIALKDMYLVGAMLIVASALIVKLLRCKLALGNNCDLFMIFATIYLAIAYIISPNRNLLSLRQLMIIPLFYNFGRIYTGRVGVEWVRSSLLSLMIITCASGYIERFILYDQVESFWNLIGIRQYMVMKGMEQWSFGVGGTPGSFYSYDLAGFGNIVSLRRMVSLLFAEPTLFGQFLVMPTIYFILKKKPLPSVFFLSAIILALSKGGLLGVLVALSFYKMQRINNYSVKIFIATASCSLVSTVMYLSYYTASFHSVAVHVLGLVNNLQSLIQFPFGKGIGSMGNMAALASYATGEALDDDATGESFLGTLAGQLGIPGVVLYILLFYHVWKINTANKGEFLSAVKYSLLATLVAGIGSESAISYVGTGYLFALHPFLIKTAEKNEIAECRQY